MSLLGRTWLESVWQDVRYACRALARQPSFAAAVIAIVALGSGAATSVFVLLDALVVKSLPVQRAERLVWLENPSFSYPIFSELQARLPVFDGVFAWNIARTYVDWTGEGGALAPADVLEVTGGFFPTLRVGAAAGRTLETDDEKAVMISHAAWRRRYGGAASAVGRRIRVNRDSFTIVGVTPPGFFGVAPGMSPEIIMAIASRRTPLDAETPASAWLHIMGRLKDGVSREQANAALQVVWPAVLDAATPAGVPGQRARFLERKTALMDGRTGFSRVRNQFANPLWLLMGLVILLLGAACASAANLLLARGVARRREIAVRLSIGASRARVFRQLVIEALLLTLAGALAGLPLASWASGLLVAFLETPRYLLVLDTSIGLRTIVFALAIASLVAPVAAILPTLAATRGQIATALKEAAQHGGGRRSWIPAKALVALQVALAVVLLAGAAMFGRSLARVLARDTGMDAERLLVVAPDTMAAGYQGPALHAFYAQLLDRLRAIPGVDAAALSWYPPISNTSGSWTQTIAIDGTPLATRAEPVFFNGVSPGYFGTVGMALGRGRDLSPHDTATAERVVVINDTLARTFFASTDPIGRRISIGRDPSRQNLLIVGQVRDAAYRTLQEPPRSVAYLPCAQLAEFQRGRDLVAEVRVASSIPAIAAAMRDEVRAIDAHVPVGIERVSDRVRDSTLNERLMARLSAVLGGAALLLACAALYGLLAYAVSRQRRDIGIRLALGARPAQVMWLIQRESLRLVAVGVVAGVAAALALGRFVRTLLFQVESTDHVALASAAAIMVTVAALAAWVPARRATRVDPLVALRFE